MLLALLPTYGGAIIYRATRPFLESVAVSILIR